MKMCGGVGYSTTILGLSIRCIEWSATRPGRRTSGVHLTGGWVGPGAGVDDAENKKILQCQKSNPGRPVRRYID
jgi:hypothetical protein